MRQRSIGASLLAGCVLAATACVGDVMVDGDGPEPDGGEAGPCDRGVRTETLCFQVERAAALPFVGFNLALVALPDGSALAAGGRDETADVLSPGNPDILRYSTDDDTWTSVASLPAPLVGVAATRVADGRVMLTGGFTDYGATQVWPVSTLLFDPATEELTQGADMERARANHHQAQLLDGTVLVVGGQGPDSIEEEISFDRYSLEQDAWLGGIEDIPGDLAGYAVAVSDDGVVFVFGGREIVSGDFRDDVWMLDPAQGQWEAAPPLDRAKAGHHAVVLDDGRALIVGGITGSFTYAEAELYDLAVPQSLGATGSTREDRYGNSTVRLSNGWVMVLGGSDVDGRPRLSTDIWDPSTEAWFGGPDLAEPHGADAVVLADGSVLIVGGCTRDGCAPTVERVVISPLQ